ncbi:MAG: universal stress protein [Thermodesulfobacteriota bacterium]
MAKYRKILVPYDGSTSAKNALRQASRLAREDQSWIKVLAVLPAYEGDLELIGVGSIKETMNGPGQQLLAEAKAIADEEGVHILTNLEQGEPYERIVHVAEDENCDLIIMGRRGLGKLERGLMGSVTARVIGHTLKDVLVVPQESVLSWERPLVALDGSPYGNSALETAFSIAQARGVELTGVSVAYTNDEVFALAPEMVNDLIDQSKDVLEKARLRAGAMDVRLTPVVREGEPHEAILAAAEKLPASLIILGSHGRKGFTRLLMGSVTEKVIGLGHFPVLVSHLANAA